MASGPQSVLRKDRLDECELHLEKASPLPASPYNQGSNP